MKKFATLITGIMLSLNAFSLDIGGINMPESITSNDNTELQLNGAGIREKWFIDLYVGGLYLAAKQQDAAAILSADEPMAIRLHMVSDLITSEKMTSATIEGFEHATNGETKPLQTEIETFLSSFAEPIKAGDIFDFYYQPGKGMAILKNGVIAQSINSGIEFKKALFGIWISDQPAQKSLRKEMLGQES